MGFKVALPYTIYVPSPVPMLSTLVSGDFELYLGYDFYPDYWA